MIGVGVESRGSVQVDPGGTIRIQSGGQLVVNQPSTTEMDVWAEFMAALDGAHERGELRGRDAPRPPAAVITGRGSAAAPRADHGRRRHFIRCRPPDGDHAPSFTTSCIAVDGTVDLHRRMYFSTHSHREG